MLANLVASRISKNDNTVQESNGDESKDVDDKNQKSGNAAEEKAKVDQQTVSFDENDVYGTLADPFLRDKKELVEFAAKASDLYTNGEYKDMEEMFHTNFLQWTEDHFRGSAKYT